MSVKRALLSLSLGVGTCLAISWLSYLPFSAARDAVNDALAMPGAVIASVIWPEGIHTGNGAPGWAIAAVLANVVVYALAWYLILRISQSRGGGRT
ncbi:hypothetical protein LVB87_07125 [Lysobacter sp. KIS68-7]|uniref:hypothetical protein n=1 Tax=Lysobacter sp. KIS68-7 TaxID=2904252 RepID=UPI001E633C4F|nr:hypothetical protein [Lysobacter sp. KIS68-7]UHQ20900.1 hypothetical protein LVB87_07125 [Lysobacter sp. KIS68-7]